MTLSNLTYFQVALLIVMIYVCVYGIVHRICKCAEQCSSNKVLAMSMMTGKRVPSSSDIAAAMDRVSEFVSAHRKEKNNDSGTV